MPSNHILTPIPSQTLLDAASVPIIPKEEPLICISDTFRDLMVFQPMYYEQGIAGAIAEVYVRKTVADMLLTAAQLLPEGYRLKILDAWRPAAVQKGLFDAYYNRLRHDPENQGKSEAELQKMATQFVSYPSADPASPFVHATGGAVDLTIVDNLGKELNMGTAFDDFTEAAFTAHFESAGDSEVRDNRRLLYHTMGAAGFTNFPAEWWHYDFGDRFWAAATHQDSIYGGIYCLPEL